ncbi:MAG TPA: CFI-box-CTERM domain-containing protein [Nitrosopumilaceae archaeon]|nr:CFI-box-CTERM domain-containing protein [Nitrosopumilaceae archaeon]
MRRFGNLAIIVLTVSILSYGFSGLTFAQQGPEDCGPNQVFQNNQCLDIDESGPQVFTLDTDRSSYEDRNTIRITGNVGTISTTFPDTPVVLIVTDPTGNIVAIGQVEVSADGQFSHNIIAGGTMKTSGDYEITAKYGAQESKTSFSFTASGFTPPPPPPKQTTCGPNQELINGQCIDKEPPPPPPPTTCGPNQELINGQCIDKEPPPSSGGPECGPGTVLKNGICVLEETGNGGGGCLIATATYGSELAPQVQFLREIRDNTVLSTSSGTSFMNSFNQFYYTFSPTIADWERQNPIFKEATKLFITPMISSLSIMTLAENGSEAEVLTFGISVIALNLGLYIAAPTAFAYKLHTHLKSRNKR